MRAGAEIGSVSGNEIREEGGAAGIARAIPFGGRTAHVVHVLAPVVPAAVVNSVVLVKREPQLHGKEEAACENVDFVGGVEGGIRNVPEQGVRHEERVLGVRPRGTTEGIGGVVAVDGVVVAEGEGAASVKGLAPQDVRGATPRIVKAPVDEFFERYDGTRNLPPAGKSSRGRVMESEHSRVLGEAVRPPHV